jgi:HPt (histidine-containing phosphotransfer) domain-containing protein
MKPEILPNPFIFDDEVDSSVLKELYENDYVYIDEIFVSTIEELRKVLPAIESSFASGDLEALRKHTHRIKPLFGFTGLIKTQSLLQEFEDVCQNYDSTAALETFYFEVHKAIVAGLNIISSEQIKLQEYNRLQS